MGIEKTGKADMFDREAFGDRLRRKRIKEGYSKLDDFAKVVHCQKSAISRWETGQNEPDYQTLVRIAKALNTTCDYLLTGVKTENIDAAREYGLSNDALRQLSISHNLAVKKCPAWYDKQIMKIHAIDFINVLLCSRDLHDIAADFIMYGNQKAFLESRKGLLDKGYVQARIDEEVIYQLSQQLEEYGYYIFNADEYIEQKRYLLHKKWEDIFQVLINIDFSSQETLASITAQYSNAKEDSPHDDQP